MSSIPAQLGDGLAGARLEAHGECSMSRASDVLLSDMELPFSDRYYPLGYPIEIVTNDPEVLAVAQETFGHSRCCRMGKALQIRIGISPAQDSQCPPEPTRRQFNHLYSLVADPTNQALLDLKTGTNFIWLTRPVIANRAYFRYNFLEKAVYLLLGASVVTDIHAACVSRNGTGLLLCGGSGAGKTTLAYACARDGWTYTSDDTSYLINDSDPPRVIGHCHRVRFRPSATTLFPELQLQPLTPRMEGKPSIEVPIAMLPVSNTSTEVTVDSVVFLNRNLHGQDRLEELPAGTATMRLRRELFSAGEIRAKHEAILEKLWHVPTYALDYCDLNRAIGALDSLAYPHHAPRGSGVVS